MCASCQSTRLSCPTRKMSTQSSNPPTKYGIILFPDFQSLDVFGPLDVLNVLSRTVPFQLSIIAETLSPVSTKSDSPGGATIGQCVVPTHTFENAPEDIEVLIVPGGKGTRDLEATQLIVDYVRKAYPKLRYLFTVCTGSTLAARAGILDGHEATSNKGSFTWVCTQTHAHLRFPTDLH